MKTMSAAGVGLALASVPSAIGAVTATRRRFAIVGVGSRHRMYQNAIEKDYTEHAMLGEFVTAIRDVWKWPSVIRKNAGLPFLPPTHRRISSA